MCEKNAPGPVHGSGNFKEAVSVHTNKVYDSCKSKECIRDLPVYLTEDAQKFINNHCVTIRPRAAELLYVNLDVEKVKFNCGFYSVDMRFYYRIVVEANCNIGCPQTLNGLAVYEKRCVLYGGEGNARIFSSKYAQNQSDYQFDPTSNLPTAIIETVEPVILDARIIDPDQHCNCGCGCHCNCCDVSALPCNICNCFGSDCLCTENEGNRLYVTLGQFSILRLERDVQLLMPAYDFCIPTRDCNCSGGSCGTEMDPCDVFAQFEFPMNDFFPPHDRSACFADRDKHNDCGCGDHHHSCGCDCGDQHHGSCGCDCNDHHHNSCGCGCDCNSKKNSCYSSCSCKNSGKCK